MQHHQTTSDEAFVVVRSGSDESSPKPRAQPDSAPKTQPEQIKLVLWRNGFSEVRRVLKPSGGGGIADLAKLASSIFALDSAEGVSFGYVDEEGDEVTIKSDAEVEAAEASFAQRGTIAKYTVQCPTPVPPAPPASPVRPSWTTATAEEKGGFEDRAFGDGKRVAGGALVLADGRTWPGSWLSPDRFKASASADEALGIAADGTWLGVFDESGARTAFFRGDVADEVLLAIEPTTAEPWTVSMDEVLARVFGLPRAEAPREARTAAAEAPRAAPPETAAPLAVHDCVELHSLAAKSFNGARGCVKEVRGDRVVVSLGCGKDLLSVKQQNCRKLAGWPCGPNPAFLASMMMMGMPRGLAFPVLVNQGG